MKIAFFLKHNIEFASSRYRGFYVASELRKNEFKIKCYSGKGIINNVKVISLIFKYDGLFIQKRYNLKDIIIAKLWKLFNKKVVFDLDDDPKGVARSGRQGNNCIRLMQLCDTVIVGNKELQKTAHKVGVDAVIIPTSVRAQDCVTDSIHNNKEITIGWIGNGKNYKPELRMLANYIYEVIERISDKKILLRIIGVQGDPEIYEIFNNVNYKVELVDAIDWKNDSLTQKTVAQFDIGTYPLSDYPYNYFKSGFKAVQYFASAVPCIASELGEAKEIISHGKDGFLVNTKEEWINKLIFLIYNEDIRRQIGKEGAKKVATGFTIESQIDKYIKVFQQKV